MKLSDKYNYEDYSISENVLYQFFQTIFFDVFSSPPQIDNSKELFENNRFKYSLNEVERRFFEKHYVSLTESISPNSHPTLKKIFPADFKLNIGRKELDILEFIVMDDKELILHGGVGWGKTTLLKYVFYYLFSFSDNLQRNYIPLYISFNKHINTLRNIDFSYDVMKQLFYSKLLMPKINKFFLDIYSIKNHDFWDYITNHEEFSFFKKRLSDLDILNSDIEDQYDKNILKERMKVSETDELRLLCLKYVIDKLNVVPIIILDDADPLGGDICNWLMWELHSLSGNYFIKTILSIRTHTYYDLFHRSSYVSEALHPVRCRIERPNGSVYLNSKMNAVEKEIRRKKIRINRPFKIYIKDTIKIYKHMIDILLREEVMNFVDALSGGDLRKWARLLRMYFQTGYIQEDFLVRKIIGISIDDKEIKQEYMPEWIAYTSIITNNYKTYFSKKEGPFERDILINIFCNGSNFKNTHLIRLQLLSYLSKHDRIHYEKLKDDYLYLFNDEKREIIKSMQHAIKRMINGGLILSPIYHKLDKDTDVDSINEIQIKPLGIYYLKNLIYNYEYLVFMKDDIELNNYEYKFADNIECETLVDRYNQLVEYLRFIYEREKELVIPLELEERVFYLNNFAPKLKSIYFTEEIAKRLYEFGEYRKVQIEKMRYIKQEIEEDNKHILSLTIR